MKTGRRIIKRVLAVILAIATMLTTDSSNFITIFAEGNATEEYTLKLNGKECMGTEPVLVSYGQAISLELSGFSAGTVTYYYSKYKNFTDDQGSTSLVEVTQDSCDFTKRLELGTVYYLGYTTESSSGNSQDYNGNHCFTVVPATVAAPADVLWNSYAATWTSVTTDSLNHELDNGAVNGYEVALYRMDGENKVPVVLEKETDEETGEETSKTSVVVAADVTTYDFTSVITNNGYGNYVFEVKAIAETATGHYEDSSATQSGELVYTDEDVPQITAEPAFDEQSQTLSFAAKDVGSGVCAYAITTKSSANELTEQDWVAIANPGAGKEADASLLKLVLSSECAQGAYSFYVRDEYNHVTKADTTIGLHVIRYQNDGNGMGTSDTVWFTATTGEYTLKTPDRTGYTFLGWYENEQLTGDAVTKVTVPENYSNEITVYAGWEFNEVQFTKQPNDGNALSFIYDGTTHSVVAAIANTDGTITWEWEKQDENKTTWSTVTGQNSDTLTVFHVADSGTYRAKATVTIGSDVSTGYSSVIDITISPATLTLTADNASITYGQEQPGYTYTPSGFVGADIAEKPVITAGTIQCPKWEDAEGAGTLPLAKGSYAIEMNGYAADDYEIKYVVGTLTVGAKSVEAEGSTVSAVLSQTEYTYEVQKDEAEAYTPVAHEPSVTVYDGGKEVSSDEYSVQYFNNVNAGTAYVKITFNKNYTGTLKENYTIAKAEFSSSVQIKSEWKYKAADAGVPSVTTNVSGGTVSYYYLDSKGDAFAGKPVDAGAYSVYAVIAETDNYKACKTEPVSFVIKPREITITADSKTWVYDGNVHILDSYKQTGDGFAAGDDFQSVIVTGSIKDKGTTGNVITYSLAAGVKPSNYVITDVNGTLKVTEAALQTPGGIAWDGNYLNAGVGKWVPVVKTNLNIVYEVQLYRKEVEGGYTKVGNAKQTSNAEYDFKSEIYTDAMQQYAMEQYEYEWSQNAICYAFSVQAIPKSGTAKDNYTYSAVSAYNEMETLGTNYVTLVLGTGISSHSAKRNYKDETINSIDLANNNRSFVVLQKERISINVACDNEYRFFDESWTITPGEGYTYSSSMDSTYYSSSKVQINAPSVITGDATGKVNVGVQCKDREPLITGFTATLSQDGKKATLHIAATDGLGLSGYQVVRKEPEVKGQTITPLDHAWVTTGISSDSKSLSTDVAVTDCGFYYLFVKDKSGNISSTQEPIRIYKIEFEKGETSATGAMPAILKLENQDVTIPTHMFENAGKSFKNWKTKNNTILEEAASYVLNQNDTLTATWTDEQYSYTVRYHYQDISQAEAEDDPVLYYKTDEELTQAGETLKTQTFKAGYGEVIDPTKDAYSAILSDKQGFELDKEMTQTIKVTENGLVLDLYYKRSQFKIVYTYTSINNLKLTHGTQTYYYEQMVDPLGIPEAKAGYTFEGWTYENLSEAPETMPAQNISATGVYVAQTVDYYVVYYYETLTEGTYALDSEETRRATQGDEITMTLSDVPVKKGFCISSVIAVKENDLPYQSTVPSGAADEATGTATAEAGEELYFVYYMNREKYDITLNVWKGDRLTTGQQIYTHVWKDIPYGTPITEAEAIAYETHGMSGEWEQKAAEKDISLDEYVVADYVDWSTETRPTSMPYGDVVISREYVLATLVPYNVDIFLENADGTYTSNGSLIYYGYLGDTVTAGADDSATINYTKLVENVASLNYYQYKSVVGEEVLSGQIVEGDENSRLHIKLYFERKPYKVTLAFYDGTSKVFHKEEHYCKWGRQFTFSPEQCFDYTIEGNGESRTYTSGTDTSSTDSFRNKNYIVSYYTYYWDTNVNSYGNASGHSSSKNLDSYVELNSSYTVKVGMNDDTYVHVYYTEPEVDKQYFYNIGYNSVGLYYGTNSFVPLTIDGYQICVANKRYLYETTPVEGTGDALYPGISIKNGSYEYRELKAGYSLHTVVYDGITYEFPVKDGYLYIPNTSNQFYEGNRISFNYRSGAKVSGELSQGGYDLAYDIIEQYLATYKSEHGDDATAPDPNGASTIYIYNPGSGHLCENFEEGHNYTFTFGYNNTMSLTYVLGENRCSAHSYKYNTLVTVGCEHSGVFPERQGYDIVWYTDALYTEPAEKEFHIKSNVTLYGRYEKSVKMNDEYLVFPLAEEITVGETKYSGYLTIAQVTAIQAANSEEYKVTTDTKKSNITVRDQETGRDKIIESDNITYYLNGVPVLTNRRRPAICFSEISMEVDDVENPEYDTMQQYAPPGFKFDDTNTDNRLKGYVQYDSVSLYAYFTRINYTAGTDRQLSDADNVIKEVKTYGQTVVLPKLGEGTEYTKEGYAFSGWELYQTDKMDENGNMLPVTTSEVKQKSDGTYYYSMPYMDTTAKAVWMPATSDYQIYHYYQSASLEYQPEKVAQLEAAAPAAIVTISFNGTDYSDGKLYTTDGTATGEVIGLSLVAEGKVYYFDNYVSNDEGNRTYTVDAAVLICCVTKATFTSEQSYKVSEQVSSDTYAGIFSYEYAVQVYKSATKTYPTALTDEHTFFAYPSMNLSYYYRRNSEYRVNATAICTDGQHFDVTITGTGDCYYGQNVSIAAILANGYEFKGWYAKSDIYNENGTFTEKYKNTFGENATSPTEEGILTALATEAVYRLVVTGSYDLVAVVKPCDVQLPTLSVSGKTNYVYGYTASSSNVLSVGADMSGVDAVTYIKSYQWKVKKPKETEVTDIPGATAASYVIPTGVDAGNYEYSCVVTISRKDNNRTVETSVSTNVVVEQADFNAQGSNLSYTYTGSKYNIPIVWPEGWDQYEADNYGFVYYYSSDEEITVDNYSDKFDKELCSKADKYYYGTNSYIELEGKYTDVRVDESGQVIPYVTYFVIHDPKGNYKDCAVKSQLTICPVELSLKANTKAFSKEYDGTTKVNGVITDTESQKYKLSTGTYFTVAGMLSGDIEASLIDFDADFNDAHVKNASAVYLRNIKVVYKEGQTNYNYTFAENYELNIPAYIEPFPLQAVWDEKRTFVYNGTLQYPTAKLKDGTVAPDGSAFTISVTNKQTNVGTYTAQAVVDDHPDGKYYSSDYSFSSTGCEYSIVKKKILVVPVSDTFTYDGTTHYLNNVTVSGYTDNEWEQPIAVSTGSHAGLISGHTITFSMNKGYVHAGTYTDLEASNVKIEETTVVDDVAVTKNVTGNYEIAYKPSTMTIKPKTVKITGIGAKDKVYDGGTDATLVYVDENGSSTITYDGIVAGDELSYDASYIHGSFDNAQVGIDKTVNVTFEAGALTGTSAADYVLDTASQTTKADITAKGLTVTAKSLEVVYGQTIPYAYECEGFGISDTNQTIMGNAIYKLYQWNEDHTAKVYVPDDKVTRPDVGTYFIEIDTSGLSNANYSISWNAEKADEQTLKLKKRPIAVTASDAASVTNGSATLVLTKPYDGTMAATGLVKEMVDFSSYYQFVEVAQEAESGPVSGDAIALIVSEDNDSFEATYNDENVNTANKVTLSGLQINNSNYELRTTSFDVKAKIEPLPLTLTAGSFTGENAITYGTQTIAYAVTTEGFLPSEKEAEEAKITYSSTYDATDTAKRNITTGTNYYKVTPVYVNAGGNYTVNPVSGDIEVKPAVITVTPAASKELTYGIDVKLPMITPEFSGFQYSETESVITAGTDALSIEEGKTTFASANGVSFVTGANAAVTGNVGDALPDSYGMNYEDTVINGLTAPNYTFETGTGTLKINRQEISISGITVTGKMYDGTTKVTADSVNLESVKIDYYVNGTKTTETVQDKSKISSNDTNTVRILADRFSVIATYADKNVGENKTVNLEVILSEEFARLYTFKTVNDSNGNASQTTASATITPAPLTITAIERRIDFGQPLTFDAEHPENYVVSGVGTEGNKTNDFVNNESYGDLFGKLTYRAVSKDESYTEYRVGSPAGDYALEIGGFVPSGSQVQNYDITFTDSSAVVLHIDPATLKTPEPVWSSSNSGTITWKEVPGIGAYKDGNGNVDRTNEVVVDHYVVKLYKTDVATGAASSCTDGTFVSGSEKTIAYQESGNYNAASNVYSIDYADLIRQNGVGIYHVQIQAIASTTNNEGYKNVHKQSALGTTAKGLFTTEISVTFASDEDSQKGQAESTPNFVIGRPEASATDSYIVLAGEKDVPLKAMLKNATGYTIASCTGAFSDETNPSEQNPVGITVSNGKLDGTVYTGALALSDAITSAANRKVVLTLALVEPTLSVELKLTQDNAPYGYSVTQAPIFTVTASTREGDTVGTDGYTYKYEWYTKDGFAGIFTKVAEHTPSSNVDSYSLPQGKVVGEKFYYAYCKVTATRTDNGKEISVDTGKNVAATIVRASITDSAVINSAGASEPLDWKYGEPRTEFAVTMNPENAAVTYWYSDSADGTYTKDKPVNVGSYYVKATIAESKNYQEFTTAPKAFSITKATLGTPANITLSASDTAPYGKISWNAVEELKENDGAENDSDMTIAVKYKVKFYYVGTESTPLVNPALLTEVVTANTWYDFTEYITKAGRYNVEVTAIVANDESELAKAQKNCNDSAVASKTALINIATEIQSDCENYTKVYDGTPMTLSVSYQVEGQQLQYQWLRNKVEITGATESSYQLTYVEDSGTYTCKITGTADGGEQNTVYSTAVIAKINPRPVTITSADAEKTYDGQPLTYEAAVFDGTTDKYKADSMDSTNHNGLVYNDESNYDSITSVTQSAQVTSAVTGENTAANTMSGIVITHYDGTSEKVVYDESKAYTPNNTNNYIVTKVSGKLTVNKRAITFTGDTDSKVYTGEEQQITTYTQNVALVEGHTVNVTYCAKGTDVDTYNGEITAKKDVVVKDGDTDVTGNYDITTVPGKLTITQSSEDWTISLANDSAVYDGNMHANTKTPTATSKTGTNTYSYSYDSDFANASSSLAALTKKDVSVTTIYVKATNPNYSKNATTTATLTITPRPVVLTWGASALTYNGSEQSIVATVSNKVDGDNIRLTYQDVAAEKCVNHATEVGEYVASVVGLDNANYTLVGATGVTQNWSISNLGNTPYAYLVGTKLVEDGEWFTSDVTVKAPDGYTIATERNGTYLASYVISTEASDNAVSYYLKNEAGYITAEQTLAYISKDVYNSAIRDSEGNYTKQEYTTTGTVKIDKTSPTGTITIKTNVFKEFINSISFGLFFKNSSDVVITAADWITGSDTVSGSGVAEIAYQKVASESDYAEDGTWTTGERFAVNANEKFIVYARIKDAAGHVTIINSNGVVVYTDAQQVTTDITFTKLQTENVEAVVATNANTIQKIEITDSKNLTQTVHTDNYEVVADSTDSNQSILTLKAAYLQMLDAGTYTLTISYNPYGVEYVANPSGESGADTNEAPAQTTITLVVQKAQGVVTFTGEADNPTGLSKTYDSNEVNQNALLRYTTVPDGKTTPSTGSVTVEYKLQSEGDNAYAMVLPVSAGTYSVRVTVGEDSNYTQAQNTGSFTIEKKQLTIAGLTAQNRKYNTLDTVVLTGGTLQGVCDVDTADVTVVMPSEGTISDTNVGNDKVVSVVKPPLSGSKKDNYTLVSMNEVKVNITPADPVITLSDKTGTAAYVYDGNSVSYVADSVALVGDEVYDASVNGALSYSYRKNGTEDAYTEGLPVDAGTYQVKATLAANGNYAESEKPATVTIKPLPVVLSWNKSSFIYDGTEKTVTASITNKQEQNDVIDDVEILAYDANSKTDKGQYTAKAISLTGSKKDNYTLARDAYASEEEYAAANICWAWNISFLPQDETVLAYIDGTTGDNGWFISDVTVYAPAGYQLSSNLNGPFTDSINVTEEDIHDIGYYLKSINNSEITAEINRAYESREAYGEKDLTKTTEVIKIDKTAPTGAIEVKRNTFKSFLNNISFGLFFKNSYDVTITGEDYKQGSESEVGSQVAKIEYQKVANVSEYQEDGGWSDYSRLSVNPTGTYVIYARITDYAGHKTIINSNGIVCYTDAQQVTADITFTKTQTEDVEAVVAMNGNTVKEISVATAGQAAAYVLSASDYEIQAVQGESNQSQLVLSHEFLQTLSAGNYVVTISYNPLGHEYVSNVDGNGNDTNEAPATTAIALTVEKAARTVEITSDPSMQYDGTQITEPSYAYIGGGHATVEYRQADESDECYVVQKPILAGDYVVRVTISEDTEGNYLACEAEKEFTISKKPVSFVGDSDEIIYDGNVHSVNTYTGEELLISGHHSNVIYVATAIEANLHVGTITDAQMVIICDEQGTDVTDNYEVTTTPGNLRILPSAEVWSVEMEDDDVIYDGLAHASTKTPSDTALSGATTYRYALAEDGEYVSDLGALQWTEVGEYPIYVEASNPNYEATATTMAWFQIRYWFEAPYAYLKGEKIHEGNDWFVSEVAITAPYGCLISNSPDGEFVSELIVDTESDQNTMSYFLKEIVTGRISPERTQAYKSVNSTELTDTIKIDLHNPTIGRIEDGGIYCENVYFDAQDKFFEKAVVDGKDITDTLTESGYFIGVDETYPSRTKQKHTIEVYDYAGRSTTYRIILHNGHVYGTAPVFDWSEDYTSATATFVCDNDVTHTLVLPCKVEKKSGDGLHTYVATVELDGEDYDDTKDIIYSVNSSEELNEGFDIRLVVSVIEGIDDVPDTLAENNIKTEEDIFKAMFDATIGVDDTYTGANTKLFDVILQKSTNYGVNWETVTEENFPRDGINICLPYPEGTTSKDHDFIITHMFTHDFNGHRPGEIETPAVTKTMDGLVFRVMSLSPIMVAWTDAVPEASDETSSGTPSEGGTPGAPLTDDRNDVWEWYFTMLAGLGLLAAANARRKKRS